MFLAAKTTSPFLVFFFFFSFTFSFSTAQDVEVDANISPKNTVFLFDFDGVVVTTEMARATWGTCATIVKHPWILLMFLKPGFYRDLVHSISRTLISDGRRICGLYGYLSHFQKNHKYFTPDIKESLMQALCQSRPVVSTVETITALKEAGYRVYVFTNNDEISFLNYTKPYLLRRFKLNLDTLFDGYFCANQQHRKPDAQMYNYVAQTLCKEGIEQLVFFDDSAKNIKAAHQANSCFKAFYVPTPEDLKKCEVIYEALRWGVELQVNNKKNDGNTYEPQTVA